MDFYTGHGSPYGWRVWLALELKKVPYNVKIMSFQAGDTRKPEFVALNPRQLANYPFARLSGPANVLIMPGLQSANISAKLLRELGGDATIGPMLIGMEKPVQIAPMTAIAPDVLTLAVLAAAGIAG